MRTTNTASLRHVFQLVLIGLVIISLAACTDQPDEDGLLGDTTAMPMDTAGTMMGDTGRMDGMRTDTVEVSLVEYEINMPTTLPAGHTIFRVTNDGTMEHNLEVEGQGSEDVFPQNLQPGETQTMEVDLQEGSYVVYCPVGDHRSRGMEVDLTVEPSAEAPDGVETERGR